MLSNEFNLFDQAEFYLSLVKQHKSDIGKDEVKDDYIIRECCLKLQMAIELMLKGLVEHLCGCDYKCSHELRDNIQIIDKNKDNIIAYDKLSKILQLIDEKADRIKDFHTKAVYINGFASSTREIDTVTEVADSLSSYIHDNVVLKNKSSSLFDELIEDNEPTDKNVS